MAEITFPESVLNKSYSCGVGDVGIMIQETVIIYVVFGKTYFRIRVKLSDKSFEFAEIGKCDQITSICNEDSNFQIIDLDNMGTRWEGQCYDNQPFGFGNIFDANGSLSYNGFRYKDQNCIYGAFYFPDTNMISYIGTHYNGVFQGYGKMFDLHGDIVYEGEWMNGKRLIDFSFPSSPLSDIICLHSQLKNINIADKSFNNEELTKLRIRYYACEELIVGSGCFTNVTMVDISNMDHLKCLKIGMQSFGMRDSGIFILANCQVLKTLQFEAFACTKLKFHILSITYFYSTSRLR